MAILLTGGAGYIGSHTALMLLEQGHEVIVLDNLSNASEKALERVAEITGKKATLIIGDATNQETLRNVFKAHSIDQVVHFAGFKAVGESVRKPLMYYRNNLVSTIALCEVMAEYNCFDLVFSSSATVYGTIQEMPLNESFPTGCTSPYGWTKYMSEQIMRDVALADPRFHIVLLRYFNPVGAHESGKIGEDPTGIPNNLMPFVCQVACKKLEKLSVYGNDYPTKDGTGVRDYLHVMDLANGHLCALRYAKEHAGAEVFNLGTGEGYSVLEFVEAFRTVNDIEVPFQIVDRRPGDVAVCYADPKKAHDLLKWEANHTLTDMCRDSWNWQKNNPRGYE